MDSIVTPLIEKARAAQRRYESYDQAAVDAVVTAAGWAIMEPARNRELAEMAVRDTGLGVVEDKVTKNHRKTLGLLRDLQGAKSVGIIAEYPELGIVEIARRSAWSAAITPSTNPGATPANKIINALKGGNAVIVAPSPKGASTAALIDDTSMPNWRSSARRRTWCRCCRRRWTKEATHELDAAGDLVVATGSQANVRAAYCQRHAGLRRRRRQRGEHHRQFGRSWPTLPRRSPAPRPSTMPPAARRKTAW
jgi:sulfoacetaldehyde dehydrogenase